VLLTGVSQALCAPLFAAERTHTSRAASLVDRAASAIATVKAFNAQRLELDALSLALEQVTVVVRKSNAIWGGALGAGQFLAMAMFVEAFWFGSALVRQGHASPGDVMAVFWACLIATGNLQLAVPYLGVVAKGRSAVAALVSLAEDDGTCSNPSPDGELGSESNLNTHAKKARLSTAEARPLRGIVPATCTGEMNLANVTFAYPARSGVPVLRDVSLYIPARETTFIVGGSGSGKSTIAQLLLRMYAPQRGTVTLDEQDVRYLDDSWARGHVAAVAQAVAVFEGTLRENVALGKVGKAGEGEANATVEEVEEACRVALLHEFVRDLPDGLDTRVGNGGAALSGGQKQRLAIARARLRDPTVLILGTRLSSLLAPARS
jgi:ATP-binding cassette, subfamily B (MDR/TAP), member 1